MEGVLSYHYASRSHIVHLRCLKLVRWELVCSRHPPSRSHRRPPLPRPGLQAARGPLASRDAPVPWFPRLCNGQWLRDGTSPVPGHISSLHLSSGCRSVGDLHASCQNRPSRRIRQPPLSCLTAEPQARTWPARAAVQEAGTRTSLGSHGGAPRVPATVGCACSVMP